MHGDGLWEFMYWADSIRQQLKGKASPIFTDMSPVIGTKPIYQVLSKYF